MALSFSTDIKHARLQFLCDAIDASPSKLIIYNAAKDVVCELEMPNPCKSSLADGVLTLNNLAESLVLINADATHAEVKNDSETLITMAVGDTTSNADLRLPTVTLFKGSLLRLDGWQITES